MTDTLTPPPTDPQPIDPAAPLGVCGVCLKPVTARTLAAAYVEGYLCRACDGAAWPHDGDLSEPVG